MQFWVLYIGVLAASCRLVRVGWMVAISEAALYLFLAFLCCFLVPV
jgi:hypothetical protein